MQPKVAAGVDSAVRPGDVNAKVTAGGTAEETAQTRFDVAVVGAGPAGCAAALALAQGGASVVILEKATLPRYKTCGGGVLHRASQLLPGGLGQVSERDCFDVALNFADAQLQFVTRRRRAMIGMTMRADLDNRLAQAAVSAGATLLQGCAVRAVRREPGQVCLDTARGAVQAQFVIAADGANSFITTACGWPDTRRLIPALEYEVQVNDADFARLSPLARFDFGAATAGYAWMFPKRTHLSLGILSMRRGDVHLHQMLQAYMQQLGIYAPLKVEKHGYVIPVSPRSGPLARGRVLLVGDAAGLVDPVTAEGITHAILSGQLAAQALLAARVTAGSTIDTAINTTTPATHSATDFDPAQVARGYQASLQKEILGELRTARFLAHLLYDYPRLRTWVFKRHGQALSELVADIVMGQRTYASALQKPGSYLKLLGL